MFVSFNVNEKPRTTLSHSPKFQFLKCRFSLTNSSPKEPKIRHRCRHFEYYSTARLLFHDVILSKRFCPNGFRQAFQLPLWIMAALEPYYFKPNMLQTPKMIAVRIVKWIIAWKKYILVTLWRMPSQLQVFLLLASFESDGMTSHKHSLATKYRFWMAASEVELWASFEKNFFRIVVFLEAETSVSGKAEC